VNTENVPKVDFAAEKLGIFIIFSSHIKLLDTQRDRSRLIKK